MFVLIFLTLIVDTIFLYLIFTEIEKCLDNTFATGNEVRRIDKALIRLSRKVSK